MKVKELFELIDTRFDYPDITIIDNPDIATIDKLDSYNIKTFKYPQDGRTYIDEMLNQFGDRIVRPKGVTFGANEYGIGYIEVEVK